MAHVVVVLNSTVFPTDTMCFSMHHQLPSASCASVLSRGLLQPARGVCKRDVVHVGTSAAFGRSMVRIRPHAQRVSRDLALAIKRIVESHGDLSRPTELRILERVAVFEDCLTAPACAQTVVVGPADLHERVECPTALAFSLSLLPERLLNVSLVQTVRRSPASTT